MLINISTPELLLRAAVPRFIQHTVNAYQFIPARALHCHDVLKVSNSAVGQREKHSCLGLYKLVSNSSKLRIQHLMDDALLLQHRWSDDLWTDKSANECYTTARRIYNDIVIFAWGSQSGSKYLWSHIAMCFNKPEHTTRWWTRLTFTPSIDRSRHYHSVSDRNAQRAESHSTCPENHWNEVVNWAAVSMAHMTDGVQKSWVLVTAAYQSKGM